MQITPASIMILLSFLVFPLISGRKLRKKSINSVASFIATIFAAVPILIIYFIVAALIGSMLIK